MTQSKSLNGSSSNNFVPPKIDAQSDATAVMMTMATATLSKGSNRALQVQGQLDQSNAALASMAEMLGELSGQREQLKKQASDASATYNDAVAQEPQRQTGQSDADYQKSLATFSAGHPNAAGDKDAAQHALQDANAQLGSIDALIRDLQEKIQNEQANNAGLKSKLSAANQQDSADNARAARDASQQRRNTASAASAEQPREADDGKAGHKASAVRHQKFVDNFAQHSAQQSSLLPSGNEPLGSPAPATASVVAQDDDERRLEGAGGA